MHINRYRGAVVTPDEQRNRVFFAYASAPPLRAEAMRDAASALSKRGHDARTWEDMKVDGRVLIDSIIEEIDASDGLVGEISSMNWNVLFELGYAVARNKPIWLAFDETDAEAERIWNEVAIFATVGRTEYAGNPEVLVGRYLSSLGHSTQPLFGVLLANGKPREENAVFAPSLPLRFSAALGLEQLLERQSHLKILGAGDDLGIAPLGFYAKEIYRSSAAIIHLLGASRKHATEHNARASFLAGFAHGLGIPLLMVVQQGFAAPLDYRDLLYQYSTSADLQKKVKEWLDTIPKARLGGRRLGRFQLDIELPLSSFGQYVAEYEADELGAYFIQTSEFSAVVAGESQIFAGRKGTGKTATMLQVALDLGRDREVLVVPIKPSSYELAGLIEVLKQFGSPAHAEYFLMTSWTFLIQSEIALRALELLGGRPLSQDEQTAGDDLRYLLQQMSINPDEDLSARLERVVKRVLRETAQGDRNDHDAVARAIRADQLSRLRTLTSRILGGFRRIAILIDNLDKNWERGADFEVNARFILSLLVAAGRIEKDFSRSRGDAGFNATLALFIRTDILDAVRSYAREPDKIGARAVDWGDEQLLVRVLEERYAANRRKRVGSASMWDELFCQEVRGLPTRDYILWRALRRPRDFVYFANSALTTAINRGHSQIDASDITYAEREYSRFAIQALIVESESLDVNLEEALYEFAGLSATQPVGEIDRLLSSAADPEGLRKWLTAASFFGVEVADRKFEYVEGEVSARRKSLVAERIAAKEERTPRLRIHPAFRPYLEISDDDLHD
ncbi:P-loop ATPase, Sll1717 family [Propionicimonas sp. T2.31MG-18]|uniref:P-loop ATPase, Sll1717 family n=1 Tax=Propionicimonas sp. T2.31MG-18 TaxID=3157620 RepID=UPI00366AB3CE